MVVRKIKCAKLSGGLIRVRGSVDNIIEQSIEPPVSLSKYAKNQ
jgi:hypothetical protein